jgi:type IV secretory pathway VirB10-like protein
MTRGGVRAAAIALLALSALAGCSRSNEPPPEPENDVEAVEPPAPPVTEAPPVAAPTPASNIADAAPEDNPGPDQQVLDDADATGMTARVRRDEDVAADSGGGGNAGAPAETRQGQ